MICSTYIISKVFWLFFDGFWTICGQFRNGSLTILTIIIFNKFPKKCIHSEIFRHFLKSYVQSIVSICTFMFFPVFSRIRCTAIKLRQICVCSRVDDWKVEFLLTCSRIKTCQVEMDLGLDSARFIGKQTAKIVIWLKSISADDEEIRCIILVESGMLCAAAAFGWAARLKYMRELMRSSLLSRFSQYLV